MCQKRFKSDSGLMGPTHALSAVALSLCVAWLAKDFMFDTLLGSKDIMLFISAIIIIIGSSLMPDLDATNSTSITTLGPIGKVLSKAMRGFSVLIQNMIKGPYDKGSDPHRGFWHTILAAFLAGILITGLANINVNLFTIFDIDITLSKLIVIIYIYISLQLGVASLFKPFYKKNVDKPLGKLGLNIASLLIAAYLMYSLPSNAKYNWIGGAVTFGWITHLIGDMLTVSGVPILFPLKYKGKRWWNFRLPLGIKAGGVFEKSILIPLLSVIIAISLFKVILLLI